MKKLINALLFLTLIFSITSCSDSDDSPTETPVVENKKVQLKNTTNYGDILTDVDGKTLYFFSKDTKDNSVCDGGCESAWPIFYAETLTVDDGLNVADFAEITRPDGQKQTTYKGWPLYYYANDASIGDINGDNANNVWFVAKPDYSLMYAKSQLIGNDGENYLNDFTQGDGETSYLVDINGRTLYIFMNDVKDTNNFTAADFSNNSVWPIVEISLDKIPSILNKDDFGAINVHGRTQLTYKGWPLYYFGQDAVRGDNKGVSVPSPGIWPIANINTSEAQ